MAVTGWLTPTTDTAVSGSWSNPTNVQAKDGAVASSTIAAKNTTASRDCGGFGFSTAVLPDAATITKVEIRPKWRVSTNASIATLRVNGKVSSTVLANHDNTSEPTTLTEQTFDVTADRSWAPADFRDGTFFVRFNAVQGNNATSCTYEFDSIEVQVTYTVVNTLEQVSFRGRNDDGNETGASWKAALNTAWDQVAGLFRVRVLAKVTAGGTAQDFKWQRTLMTALTQIANTTAGTNQAFGRVSTTTQRVGESFTTPAVDDGDYFITSAIFRFRAVGSPTDDIQCFITSALSGETVLHAATNTVAPRDTVNYAEFTFNFSNANLTPGTLYYVKCKRTGALNDTNYYQADITLTNPYSGGTFIRYDSTAADWQTSAANEAYFKIDGQGKQWGDVPAQGTGSVPLRYAASSNVTDAGATTQQLGAGTFKAGLIYETAHSSTVAYTAANDESEIEAVFEAVSGQVTVGDTYKFRAVKADGTAFGTYTQTPHITIASGTIIAGTCRVSTRLSSVALTSSIPITGTARANERLRGATLDQSQPLAGTSAVTVRLQAVTLDIFTAIAGTLRSIERLQSVEITQSIPLAGNARIVERLNGVALESALPLSGILRQVERLSGVTLAIALPIAGTLRSTARLPGTTLSTAIALAGMLRSAPRMQAVVLDLPTALGGTLSVQVRLPSALLESTIAIAGVLRSVELAYGLIGSEIGLSGTLRAIARATGAEIVFGVVAIEGVSINTVRLVGSTLDLAVVLGGTIRATGRLLEQADTHGHGQVYMIVSVDAEHIVRTVAPGKLIHAGGHAIEVLSVPGTNNAATVGSVRTVMTHAKDVTADAD